MTFISSDHGFIKKGLMLLALFTSFHLNAALTPISVPPDAILCGNVLLVDEYLDCLTVFPGSDLARVICELPVDGCEFVRALDHMHPTLFQDLTLMTNENMQTARQTMLGRNSFLRFDKCKTFDCLYGDCNIGPSEFWFTPMGTVIDQANLCNLRGYRANTAGLMVGVDSQPNKNTVLGWGLGYSWSDLNWKKDYGSADANTIYFGVYGTSIHDHFYLDGAVLGSYEFYTSERKIRFTKFEDRWDDFYCHPKQENCNRCHRKRNDCGCNGNGDHNRDFDFQCDQGDCHHRRDHCCNVCQTGPDGQIHEINSDCCPRPPPKCQCCINRKAKSRFRGYGILSHIGMGLKFNICGLDIIPFGSIDYTFVDQDGHVEHNARSLNLHVKSNHAHLLRSEGGLTLKGCIPYNCSWFRPSATVSYVNKTILQGDKFEARLENYEVCNKQDLITYGERGTRSYLCVGIGLEVQFYSQYIVSLNYDADLSKKQTTQRGTIRVQRVY